MPLSSPRMSEQNGRGKLKGKATDVASAPNAMLERFSKMDDERNGSHDLAEGPVSFEAHESKAIQETLQPDLWCVSTLRIFCCDRAGSILGG